MVAGGGHVWLLPGGACVVARGGMCGCSGGGHVWLLPGGGICGCSGGHAWLLPGGACLVAPGGACVGYDWNAFLFYQ